MGAITWRKAGVYVLIALPVVGLAAIAAIGRQQPDSASQGTTDPVADAARKAREQKKTEPKPKKVYTNEDFGGGNPAPTAAPPSGSATATSKETAGAGAEVGADKSAPTDKAPEPANTEEAWRKRFKDARAKLAQAEQELEILQREEQKAQVQYYGDPQKALSEQYTRKDVIEKDTKIAAKKQEIEQMKQRIADLEDELRKSGGDPGWAR